LCYCDTSEDNTTRYWREQKEKGKLQITEELNNGLRKTKSRLINKYLVIDTVRNKWTTPLGGGGGGEFYVIKNILIENSI
jgi:hypothetical protein